MEGQQESESEKPVEMPMLLGAICMDDDDANDLKVDNTEETELGVVESNGVLSVAGKPPAVVLASCLQTGQNVLHVALLLLNACSFHGIHELRRSRMFSSNVMPAYKEQVASAADMASKDIKEIAMIDHAEFSKVGLSHSLISVDPYF
ncbi:hypothetical protein F3Y22_tig00111131pilonHSYRG00160 [Hibiscus syriacus]|uniref:Uncharacterized protein n=1 Tax=Hibiscus syriacus TaxID=106335 RepID=A0A6A2YZP8_HIBSY|nr:hypothetical protein F3Y22_tig00111131pilonHSYRG00160 [Hibiscus syriacus]